MYVSLSLNELKYEIAEPSAGTRLQVPGYDPIFVKHIGEWDEKCSIESYNRQEI